MGTHPSILPPKHLKWSFSSFLKKLAYLGLFAPFLPCGLVIWYIFSANTDVVFSDLWGHIHMVQHFLDGSLQVGELFQAHNQNRPLVLNILILASVLIDHLNVRDLLLWTVVFQLVSLSIFFYLTRRLSFPNYTKVIFYIFTSLLIFNLGQSENYTLSINSVFASCVTFSLLALVAWQRFLDGKGTWTVAALAVGCAELATFSMGGGLVVWPVLLIHALLYGPAAHGRRGWALFIVLLVGAVTLSLYSIGLSHLVTINGLIKQIAQPETNIRYFVIIFGASVMGFWKNQPVIEIDEAFGVFNVLIYVMAILSWLRLERDEKRVRLPFICAIVFALGEAALIWIGRAGAGFNVAASPRYMTLTVIGLLAAMALVLDRASRSALYLVSFTAFAATLTCAVVVSDISEIKMARGRKNYEEHLKPILEAGTFSEVELHQLEWFEREDVIPGVETLKRYKLSQFQDQR